MMGMPAGLRSTDASLIEGKPLAMFAPYIGDWEVNSEWGNGLGLRARIEYRVLMSGAYVDAMTWAKDGDGEPYLRYYTVFTWDNEKKQIVSHGFQSDGEASTNPMTRGEDGAFIAEWGEYPQRIRQQVDRPVDREYRWQVWTIPAEGADPRPMIDANWERVMDKSESGKAGQTKNMTDLERFGITHSSPPDGPYPIDASLFVQPGRPTTSFEITERMSASPDRLFRMLTTEGGMELLYGIESRIDLAVGGPYEWYFLGENPYGTKGGEGNQVLAFEQDRMLAVSWNAPPTQPESRAKRTIVTITFEPDPDGSTLVRLVHSGFGAEPHWQETYEYFKLAWGSVLQNLKGMTGG
mgnify:CR=1 FL=1